MPFQRQLAFLRNVRYFGNSATNIIKTFARMRGKEDGIIKVFFSIQVFLALQDNARTPLGLVEQRVRFPRQRIGTVQHDKQQIRLLHGTQRPLDSNLLDHFGIVMDPGGVT